MPFNDVTAEQAKPPSHQLVRRSPSPEDPPNALDPCRIQRRSGTAPSAVCGQRTGHAVAVRPAPPVRRRVPLLLGVVPSALAGTQIDGPSELPELGVVVRPATARARCPGLVRLPRTSTVRHRSGWPRVAARVLFVHARASPSLRTVSQDRRGVRTPPCPSSNHRSGSPPTPRRSRGHGQISAARRAVWLVRKSPLGHSFVASLLRPHSPLPAPGHVRSSPAPSPAVVVVPATSPIPAVIPLFVPGPSPAPSSTTVLGPGSIRRPALSLSSLTRTARRRSAGRAAYASPPHCAAAAV